VKEKLSGCGNGSCGGNTGRLGERIGDEGWTTGAVDNRVFRDGGWWDGGLGGDENEDSDNSVFSSDEKRDSSSSNSSPQLSRDHVSKS
jgi:hypothetical protein